MDCNCLRCREIAGTEAVRSSAVAVAEKLLHSILSRDQLREWKAEGRFNVTGKSGRLFDVKSWNGNGGGHTYNVVLRSGPPYARRGSGGYLGGRSVVLPGDFMCAFTAGGVPLCDHLVAQKLLLEHDDQWFMDIANNQGPKDRLCGWHATAMPSEQPRPLKEQSG